MSLLRELASRLRLWLDAPRARMLLRGRLREPYWRWRFDSFGRGTVLLKPRWLMGAHKISIGSGALMFENLWLAVERDCWDSDGPALHIGNGCVVRAGTTISAAESVIIEDDVAIGGTVLIIDSEHGVRGPSANVTANPLVTAPIRIGRGTMLGEHVCVLRGTTIGERCVIGSNSVVRGEIPPYSIAVGAPARVVGTTRPE